MLTAQRPSANPDPRLNVRITAGLIEKHGLTPDEYSRIVSILGREPNLTELGVFSVMWSEHCSYKNSKHLLKTLPIVKVDEKALGQVLVKAGEENAGVIDIGDSWAICFKIESHNHPSAVEPFEGAATGVGGILRDIFTMGARPVLLTNSLRFGELSSKKTQRLFRGVVSGISHYGNCMGIPNVGGDTYFDSCYDGNPLVNALALGVLRHDEIKRGAAHGVGNPVYYVGAPTGRDGLGGASFASKELSEESAQDRPAVQKGDPFMEKLLMEACLEMMQVEGLVVGIQDMGAAGLTCSIAETAARGGTGIEVDLDKVPARETGMNSYEFLLSESQERMLVIVQKGREDEIEAIFEKWDLHAVQIGEVTDGESMVIKQGGEPVVVIPAAALADEAPLNNPASKEPSYLKEVQAWTSESIPDLTLAQIKESLPKLLADPVIAHKKWIWQQYDHSVMASTAVVPGSDAGVIRVRVDKGKEKYIAITNDCNNAYCYANPYQGAMGAVVEALRNLACTGARPLGLTNNLNFGNPNKPEAFYQLKECVRGLADACKFFDLPVVGGNVSLYNEHNGKAIDPTPVVSIAGIIKDKSYITKQYAPVGALLVLLGGMPNELGASRYLKTIHSLKTGKAPKVDLESERRLCDFLLSGIEQGLVQAAHDLSEGGLLCCIAEMLFHDLSLGVNLSLNMSGRYDESLFGESHGRIVVACSNAHINKYIVSAREAGVTASVLGEVNGSGEFNAFINRLGAASWKTKELYAAWSNAIPRCMG